MRRRRRLGARSLCPPRRAACPCDASTQHTQHRSATRCPRTHPHIPRIRPTPTPKVKALLEGLEEMRRGDARDPETKAVVFSQARLCGVVLWCCAVLCAAVHGISSSCCCLSEQTFVSFRVALRALLPLRSACAVCLGNDERGSITFLPALNPFLSSEPHPQFTTFLDEISAHLRRAGWPTARLDGAMPNKARAAALEGWRRPNAAGAPRVLLVSLRAGGTGLNLTAASHCFLMDLWWNEAAGARSSFVAGTTCRCTHALPTASHTAPVCGWLSPASSFQLTRVRPAPRTPSFEFETPTNTHQPRPPGDGPRAPPRAGPPRPRRPPRVRADGGGADTGAAAGEERAREGACVT